MADDQIQVRVTLLDEVSESVKAMRANMERSFEETRAAAQKTSSTFGELKSAILGVVSVTAIFSFLKNASEAANQQSITQGKLAAALGHTSAALLDQAEVLKKKSLYDDDEILASDAILAGYVKNEDQIKKLIPAVMDLATATGMNLQEASKMVARGFASDTGELGRFKVAVDGSAGSSQRLDSIVSGLTTQFGGQAAAAYNASSGVDTFKKAADDFTKGVGKVFNKELKETADNLNTMDLGFAKLGENIALFFMRPLYIALDTIMLIEERVIDFKKHLPGGDSGYAQRMIAEIEKQRVDLADKITGQAFDQPASSASTTKTAAVFKEPSQGGSNKMVESYRKLNDELPGGSKWVEQAWKYKEEQKKLDQEVLADAIKSAADHDQSVVESAQLEIDAAKRVRDFKIQMYSDVATSFGTTLVMMGQAMHANAEQQRALAIGQALINTAVSITKTASSVPYPFNIPMTVLAGLQGAAQIGIISSQKFERGGIVGGSSYSGDNIPVRANSREMYLTVPQQARLFDIANGKESTSGHTFNFYDNSGSMVDTFRSQVRSGAADLLIQDLRRKVAV